MKCVSFELSLALRAQTNGTLVATCEQIPLLVAGHDAESLADKLVSVLSGVVSRLDALGDPSETQAYLASRGVDSTVGETSNGVAGFDEDHLRTEIKTWAAKQVPSTLQCPIAA